jgi:hypothetical protein
MRCAEVNPHNIPVLSVVVRSASRTPAGGDALGGQVKLPRSCGRRIGPTVIDYEVMMALCECGSEFTPRRSWQQHCFVRARTEWHRDGVETRNALTPYHHPLSARLMSRRLP